MLTNVVQQVKPKIMKWVAIFHSWDKRKQMMVIGFSLLFYVYILNANFVAPGHDNNRTASQKIVELDGQIQDLNKQTQNILAEVQSSIANPNSKRTQSFTQQLDDLDKKLSLYNQDLVSAKDMGMILRKVLSEESGLELISITSLPSVDIMLGTNLPPELRDIPNRSVLYKRGARLVFQGGYFETLSYLSKLENYGKRIFWDDFSYTVVKYPKAQVVLTVYTLTSEEGWVGG